MPSDDARYLRECLHLAAPLRGVTFPNPLVGCVIVRKDKIVGQGVHRGVGTPHAEAVALAQAGKQAKGSTLYVNLEPCCHFGNTPPCTQAIIKAGIARVVFSVKDPNPLVKNGNSERILKKAGIKVTVGVLEKEARILNEKFLYFYEKGKTFVSLKLAASLDGKIATATGNSKWITGVPARAFVQLLRKESDAIAVGANTVLNDDPELLIRDGVPKKRLQPLRIIFDSNLKIPLSAKVLHMKGKGNTLILTTNDAPGEQIRAFEHLGVEVHVLKKDRAGHVDLEKAVEFLTKRQVTSLLIEGGGEIAAAALNAHIVTKLYYFIAPKIIGGRHAMPAVGGDGVLKVAEALKLNNMTTESIGEDLLVQAYPEHA